MKEKLKELTSQLLILRCAPRELWIVYLVNVTEYIGYTLMQFSLMLWLMSDMSLTDTEAPMVLMIWGMVLSAMMSVSGMVTDALGIRRSLFWGYLVCFVGRLAISFNIPFIAAVIIGLSPIAVGMAFMVPVSTAAIRRYTNSKQRSMAFSLFYVLFNVGYAIGGKAWDMIRQHVKDVGGKVSVVGTDMSDHQFNFFIAAIITTIGVVLIVSLIRKNIYVKEDVDEKVENKGFEPAKSESFKKETNPLKIFLEVIKEKRFWAFMAFMLICVGAKSVFYHMHYSLPPFAERYIGEGAKIGTAWGMLNPMLIVILVPFIGAWTQKISAFKMVIVGTFISALSSFILCLPGEWFVPLISEGSFVTESLRWFLGIKAGDPIHPWYIPLILFVVFFTIGEGIWSPRLMEYTAIVAPKERVGTYMSLSVLPWFASKPLVGLLQTWILPAYAPKDNPDAVDPFMFWLVIAISALATPILIIAFKGIILKATGGTDQVEESSEEQTA